MATITLDLETGQHVDFDVDLDATGPAYFMFGVRRSGSSLFTTLVKALSESNGRHFVDASTFFDRDVRATDWQNDPALRDLIRPGNVYGGFRDMPLAIYDHELLRSGRRLLLVRDPRDALVSLYYAISYSHPVPGQDSGPGSQGREIANRRARARASSIDEFVLRSLPAMHRTLTEYSRLRDMPGTVLFRYEDVIFDKRSWLKAIAAAFDWTATEEVMDNILDWADVRPTSEDPQAFIRRVTPGDHLDKLAPATIAEIDRVLGPVAAPYGYT